MGKLVLDVECKEVHVEGNKCKLTSFQRFVSWVEVWAHGWTFCESCRATLLKEARG